MPTFISESTLRSRAIRRQNTGDPLGIRRINPKRETPQELIASGAKWLLQKVARFVGFIFGKILRVFPMSISSIFQMLVQAYFTLKTFDWNQADAAIEKRIAANNKMIKDGLAPILGSALGWGTVRLANFAIGKVAGKLTGSTAEAARGINIPVVSAKVGLALAEEGNQEIRSQVLTYLTTVQRAITDNLFMSFILTARNNRWFGFTPVTSPQPNGSFAAKIEEKIEQLPTDWQNFAEELIEGFEEGIIEAGYVIAFEIDDYYLAQKMANQKSASEQKVTLKLSPATSTNV